MKIKNVCVIFFLTIISIGCKEDSIDPILKYGRKYQCFYNGFDTTSNATYLYMQFVDDDDMLNAYSELPPDQFSIKKGGEYVHSASYSINGDSIEIVNALSTFEGLIRNDTIYFTVKNYAYDLINPQIYKRNYKLLQ